MLKILTTLLLTSFLQAQEIPKPTKIENQKPQDITIPCGKNLIYYLGKTKVTKLQHKNLTPPQQKRISTTHTIYDLKKIATHLTTNLHPNTYAIYDQTAGKILAHGTPIIETNLKQLVTDTLQRQPQQIHIQATILSVERPKALFPTWTQELIQKQKPTTLATFNITSRSGIKATSTTPTTKDILEIEPTLGEDYKTIDIRLALTIHPTKTYQGITLNTGLTLYTNTPFIQPIGISTSPTHQTILTLTATAKTPENLPTPK